MKLKPIVASMILLGLAAHAFADAPTTVPSPATQSQLDSMKAQLNKMEAIIDQNSSGYFGQPADWTSRITLSGLANINAWVSNRTPNFVLDPAGVVPNNANTGYTSNLDVNNADIFVDAQVNDWTKAHFDFQYTANKTTVFTPAAVNPIFNEGYVTIGNFTESPIFFRAGQEYVPFGMYNRNPIVVNPTQYLSETRAVAAQLGFVSPVGFYGSGYVFRGLPQANTLNVVGNTRPRLNNGGADIGYAYANDTWGTKLDAGWIYNMADVNYVAQALAGNYVNNVSGLTLSGDFNYQQFDAGVRYVTALKSFAPADMLFFSGCNATQVCTSAVGAKPWALGLDAGYSFPVRNHDSRFGLGWQRTAQTSSNVLGGIGPGFTVLSVGGFGLPRDRFYANYSINLSKWTDLGVEVYNDRDYGIANRGTAKNATVGVAQLSVKIA